MSAGNGARPTDHLGWLGLRLISDKQQQQLQQQQSINSSSLGPSAHRHKRTHSRAHTKHSQRLITVVAGSDVQLQQANRVRHRRWARQMSKVSSELCRLWSFVDCRERRGERMSRRSACVCVCAAIVSKRSIRACVIAHRPSKTIFLLQTRCPLDCYFAASKWTRKRIARVECSF